MAMKNGKMRKNGFDFIIEILAFLAGIIVLAITFSVTAIATGHHGVAVDPTGIDLIQALEFMENGKSLDALSSPTAPMDNFEFIQRSDADILFENSPVNYESGQPAVDHIKTALELNMHAITANKGPVVHAYRQLTDLARSNGRNFYSANETIEFWLSANNCSFTPMVEYSTNERIHVSRFKSHTLHISVSSVDLIAASHMWANMNTLVAD